MKSLSVKTCTNCKQRKGINYFRKQKRIYTSRKTGIEKVTWNFSSWCKSCTDAGSKTNKHIVLENGATKGAFAKKLRRAKLSDNFQYCIQSRLGNYRNRSIEPCDLTVEYLMDLYKNQNGLCYYTNEKLDYTLNKKEYIHEKAMSLDKLDPKKGYVKDNVVWCLNAINSMKFNNTEEEFYKLMEKILDIRKMRKNE
jgi:hypothetical protein